MCPFCDIFYNKKLVFFFILFFIPLSVFPQTDKEKVLDKLDDSLKIEKKTLEKVVKKEQSFLTEIDKLNKVLTQKIKKLEGNKEELEKTHEAIKGMEGDINKLAQKILKRKTHLNKRLIEIYKHQRARNVSALISSKGYGELLKRIQYLEILFRYDKKIIRDYVKELEKLSSKRKELNEQYAVLENIRKELQESTNEVIIEREKKDILLRQVQNEKVTQKKVIKELEYATRLLLKKIAEGEEKQRQEETRKEEERLRLLKKEQKEAEQQKIALAKKKKAQQFSSLKGFLPWPIKDEVLLSFGSQMSHGLNVPVLRNGIVIKAAAGADVKAIAQGVVVFSDWFKGYGNLLIINHGSGYHSLYAYLDESLLPVGDKIKPLQVVGRVGESGLLNKTGLYFEIRYKGKPANPLKWLKKN